MNVSEVMTFVTRLLLLTKM